MAKNSEVKNSFAIYIAAGRIIAMLLGFAIPIFLTRIFTKNEYGLYSQFYTVLTLFGSILAFGIQSNLFYFYPTASNETRKTIIGNTWLLLCLFGITGSIFLLLPGINSAIIGNPDIRTSIYILSICICLFVPVQILQPLIVVANDKWTTVFYPPSEVLFRIVVVIFSYYYWGTLQSVFISILILQVFWMVFVSIYLFRNTQNLNSAYFDVSLIKKQLSYGLPFGIAVILATLAQQFDKLISISYLSATEYATYSLAFIGIPGIMQIYEAIGQVNIINMTKAYQAGNKNEVILLYKDFITKTMSFSLPVILIVHLYSKEIIVFLFTEKYADTIPFFRIYILSFIFVMLGAGVILRAMGKTKLSLKGYIYSSLFTLPATFLLVKYYGIWGAITSVVFSTIIPKIFQIVFEIREMQISFIQYFPLYKFGKIFLYSFVCLIPFIILHQFVEFNILTSLLLSSVYIAMVYLLEIKNDIFILNKVYVLNLFNSLLFKFTKAR